MSGRLVSAAEHAVGGSGKLLRPQLLLDACRAVAGDPASVLPAAIGTELGHIASLVHDDVIDGDNVRRGRPAVHSAFGIPLAILTGDLFVFQMFACYVECSERGINAERTLRAIHILSQACIDVCRGQALEAEIAGDCDTTESTYFEVVRLKTAGVCRAAAEIGATLGGGSPQSVSALRGYGEALGMAFQILDDVLEYAGEPDRLGKPLDSDLRNHRVTLPLIYALNSGSETRTSAMRWLREDSNGRAPLAALFEERGIVARARQTARSFTQTAQRHLRALPSTDARERLRSYAVSLLERDR
jgi:geranylgeranyl diphosphate synthase type I